MPGAGQPVLDDRLELRISAQRIEIGILEYERASVAALQRFAQQLERSFPFSVQRGQAGQRIERRIEAPVARGRSRRRSPGEGDRPLQRHGPVTAGDTVFAIALGRKFFLKGRDIFSRG